MAFSQVVKYAVGDHLVMIRHAKNRDADDMTMFPDFFERDFSVATATGFIRVWDGTYVMLKYIQEHLDELKIAHGANVIELGSGSGLLGLCVAALGGNVLLSDVKSSIDCITRHNIVLNASGGGPSDVSNFFVKQTLTYRVGSGVASVLPINWSEESLGDSVMAALPACDIILACDCIWIPELALLCSATCAKMLAHCRKGTRVLLSYPHRGADPNYSSPKHIEESFGKVGLRLKWLLTQPADSTKSEVLEISLLEAFLDETSGR